MKPIRPLVRITHGSRLYGTHTPDSDYDFKSVHVPSGRSILLQKAENVVDRSVVDKDESGKNTAAAVDDQSYSVQKFFELITLGDMTATEMLFAPNDQVRYNGMAWPILQSQGKWLINRDVRGFVGYCRRQAAKYGIRGSRMAAVQGLRELLKPLATTSSTATLAVLEDELRSYADATPHTAIESIAGGDKSVKLPHIVCCDRKMPFTSHVAKAFEVYDKVWQNYGERARQAMNNEGIDWKAMSHAVRVAEQAKELLLDHRITFPRPNADYLRSVKLGERPYDEVSEVLERLLEEVEAIESTLPKKSDHKLMQHFILEYHSEQVK